MLVKKPAEEVFNWLYQHGKWVMEWKEFNHQIKEYRDVQDVKKWMSKSIDEW